MTRYVQIDLVDAIYVVSGQLLTQGMLDTATFPAGRRFLDMGTDMTTQAPGGSTVVITDDPGTPILPYGPNTVITPPEPPPPPPPEAMQRTIATAHTKLDQILALLQKP